MTSTIFDVLSIDRTKSKWEEKLYAPTPVELVQGLYFKREDKFAPLGYGGVNGGKVRQIVYVVDRYLKGLKAGAKPGLLMAGSVKSPNLGRVAAVAKHFGIPSTIVMGANPATAYHKHENVRIAANLGASFHSTKVAYNPAIQRAARQLHELPTHQDHYLVEYGLSLEGTAARIEAFYKFCSEQVKNLPLVETLLVPAGSCNTTIAVLYGFARFRPKIKNLVLFGIGPTRIDWFEERLKLVEQEAGIEVSSLFQRNYVHHPELATKYGSARAPYQLSHFDLHSTKFASYQDEMPETYGGIVLHPTYEGKMLRYMRRHQEFKKYLEPGRSCFWVVGSEPSWQAMEPNLERGDVL